MQIKYVKQGLGSNTLPNTPLEVQTVRVSSSFDTGETATEQTETHETHEESQELSAADRRAKRREEFREAASIREKALQMQRQAEAKIRETQQFSQLLEQAKEDPTVLAKALGISPEEYQRRIFNKMYSIKDDPNPTPQKEETFEEQTRRKLEEYEQERQAERARREEEARQYSELQQRQIKHKYIQDNILPAISEEHEFIHRNDKESCAALVYDLMNQAYQEHCQKGGSPDTFSLHAQDVVNQLEEELQKRAEEQIQEARNIGKLKKYFSSHEEEEFSIKPKVKYSSSPSPTLSRSLGPAAPPSLGSSSLSSAPQKKIPLSDRNARREAAKRILGAM